MPGSDEDYSSDDKNVYLKFLQTRGEYNPPHRLFVPIVVSAEDEADRGMVALLGPVLFSP
jgi:hypothetical protein